MHPELNRRITTVHQIIEVVRAWQKLDDEGREYVADLASLFDDETASKDERDEAAQLLLKVLFPDD